METKFSFDKDLIIIDVETSGITEDSSVIQLGAVRFCKNGVFERGAYFSSYIKPYLKEWSEQAFSVHHISQKFLETHGCEVKDVLTDFSKWVFSVSKKDCYIAQWSCGFDTSMLQRAYKYANITYPFTYRSYDIASIVRFELAKRGFNTSKGLGESARILGIDCREFKAHDALEDAKLTALCLEKLINETKKNSNTV